VNLDNDGMRQKLSRNLGLISQDLSENPNDKYLQMMMYKTVNDLRKLGDFEIWKEYLD
jgi:hypothetical protein